MQITASKLGHSFQSHTALFSNLDFEIKSGQLVAVTGPSGSGKSTLLSILAGWEKPGEGAITFTGVDRRSWVFQNPHGVAGRTAIDHVALPLLALGLSRSDAEQLAAETLTSLNLLSAADKPFRALSGGEAQRLMMARALCSSPDLLLMDEPTAQLDRTNSEDVIGILRALAGRGPAIVIATHDSRVREACTHEIQLASLS